MSTTLEKMFEMYYKYMIKIILSSKLLIVSRYFRYAVATQLICLSSLIAIGNNVQDNLDINKVNLKLSKGEYILRDLLNEIQSATDLQFSYDNNEIKNSLDKRVYVSKFEGENTTLFNILSMVSTQTEIGFNQIGKYINLKKVNDSEEKQKGLEINSDFELNGKVIDEKGEPLPGVNILLKNTTIGTISDYDGNYKLSVPENSIVVFTFIGYQSQEQKVSSESGYVEVQLIPEVSELDEIVVIGYTTQQKNDLTGSIGVVDMASLKNLPVPGIDQSLQGRISGVQVSSDGSPGGGVAVRIRGYGTLGNNDPLYIIDGVQTKVSLNQLNANDIESIQVLKDASATAIYGSRAANGVVIITTKKGKFGEKKITFDSYWGIQSATNLPKMLNTKQYGELLWEAQRNAGITPSNEVYGSGSEPVIPEFLIPTDTEAAHIRSAFPGTDWFDELFDPALLQFYNIGYQVGSQNFRTSMSTSYFNQKGIMAYTGFERYNFRINSEYKSKNDLMTFGENLSVSYSNQNFVNNNAALGSSVTHAYRMRSIVPLRDINGDWASSVRGVQGAENPVALNYFDKDDERNTTRLIGDFYAELKLLEKIKVRTGLGIDLIVFDGVDYSPKFVIGDIERTTSSISRNHYNSLDWIWNNTIRYANNYGKHSFSIIAGSEAIKHQFDEFEAFRNGFLIDDPNYMYLSSGEGQQTNSGFGTKWSLFSFFGRIDYEFANKYLISASARRDGSSRFGRLNRFANFHAYSAGWRLSEEAFFPKVKWINNFKIRGSWGRSGNQEIGDFPSFSTFSTNNHDANYDINGANNTVATGFTATKLGNPKVKWETTTQSNFGLDLGILEDKITLGLDYFVNSTEDILVQRPTLAVEGQADAPFVNAGKIKNSGFEFEINYTSRDFGGVTFDIASNLSFFRNQVVELADDVEFLPGKSSNSSTRNLTISRTAPGLPIAQLYGHVVDGIFQSQEDVDQHAEQAGKGIGRFKFRDIDGNGIVDDNDRTVIGNPHPDFSYGVNIAANYKQFDLSIFFQGVEGVDLYNFTRYYTDFFFDNGNRHERVLNAWTPENPNASIPQLSVVDSNNELRPSTYFVEDGSYLRLKNAQIGYNTALPKLGITKLRVYLQAHNLITLTAYKGLDPEVGLVDQNDSDRNLDIGVDRGVYPNARSFQMGLNLEF